MKWRGRMVAMTAIAAAVGVAGCSHTVSGTAQLSAEGMTQEDYGYQPDRCGLLQDIAVQRIVGADELVRAYSGAVCQYALTKGPTAIDLTYSWFETGSLDRERGVAQSAEAQVTDIVVERHDGFLARRSITGNACSATVGTNPGVAKWWVQIRGQSTVDPCQLAQSLLSKTLTSAL